MHILNKCLCAAALFMTGAAAGNDECIDAAEIVGASYVIADASDEHGREFSLLRQSPARLLYSMPDQHLTQIYERYGADNIKLIEYFDLESIGVEHEPGDGVVRRNWESIYSIFPTSRLEGLEETDRSSFRCLDAVEYSGLEDGAELTVTYLPDAALPLRIRRETAGGWKSWELQRLITDRELIDQMLTRVDSYTTYDYADLGDSEHEEFFRNSRYLTYKLGHEHEH